MLVALALCSVLTVADARMVWRWTENGVDHYSDVEHPGAERVWLPDDARSKGGGPPRPAAPPANPQQDPGSDEFRQARCDQKKAQLQQYEEAGRLIERSGSGEEHVYTPEEREQLLVKTRAEIVDYCGEGESP